MQDVFQYLQDHGETTTLMKEFGKWDFDVIELDRLSMGNALYIVGLKGVTKLVVSFGLLAEAASSVSETRKPTDTLHLSLSSTHRAWAKPERI